MAGFKDFVDLTVLTESDLDDYLAKQAVMKFASAAARDAAVTGTFKREGMLGYLDDTNCLNVSRDATLANWSTVGPVHGALQAFTPVIVQGATPTLTVNAAKYQRIGRWVQGSYYLTLTSGGTAANQITVSLPVAPALWPMPCGTAEISDASANLNYTFIVYCSSATVFQFVASSPGGVVRTTLLAGSGSNTFQAALASGDTISMAFGYEAGTDG